MDHEAGWHPKTAEIIFALLLALIPSSFDMPVVWRCIAWALAWVMLLHLAFITVGILRRIPAVIKISTAIGLTGLLVAATYLPIRTMWHEEQAALMSGTLKPPTSTRRFQDSQVEVQIGTDADSTKFNWTGGNHPLMTVAGSNLSIRRQFGELLVSTQVRDRQGKIVVEITDNKWRVSGDSSVCWDKNYTRNALEVMDGRGRIVLQIIVLPESVRIQGEWWNEDGNGGRVLRPFPYDKVKTGPVFIVMTQLYHPNDPAIEPLFKYPSKDHWGEFADWFKPQASGSQ